MKSLGTASAVLALSVAVFGCNTNRGPDPKKQVDDALKNANVQHVDVNYDRDAKIVKLQGEVESPAEKARAEQVATQVVGTSGRVLNEVTVKGVDTKTADDMDGSIRDALKDRVDNDTVLKDRHINFDVNNGAVEIKGSVASAAEKNRVGEMVRSVNGVKDVANGLEVKPADYRDEKTSRPKKP
jgi:osmotically-inducible protein OsmY